MNFELIDTYQDCTADYDVILDNKNTTLKEFINLVLKERNTDYGFFQVNDDKLKYSNGQLLNIPIEIFTEKQLNTNIFDISAYGGYGLMNYNIVL